MWNYTYEIIVVLIVLTLNLQFSLFKKHGPCIRKMFKYINGGISLVARIMIDQK